MIKKYVLLVVLQLLSINELFARRYQISPEEGSRGLIVSGVIILLLAVITMFLYIRQRR